MASLFEALSSIPTPTCPSFPPPPPPSLLPSVQQLTPPLSNGYYLFVDSDLRGDTLDWHLHSMGHNFTTPSKLKILRQIAEVC